MPSNRTRRSRSRRSAKLTGAELFWLTGDAQGQHCNKFELLRLEHPTCPDQFERVESVLERAAGIVPPERIEELRRELAGRRDRFHKYRDDPAAAWREDAKKYGI